MNKEKKKSSKGVPVAAIAIATAIVIVAVAFFIPKQNGTFNLKSTLGYFQLKGFLSDVVAGKFDKAAENIYFYNGSLDTPVADTEAAKSEWIQRMTALKNDSLSDYMSYYSNISISLVDGNLTASFSVTVCTRGVERTYSTNVVFQDGKIVGISNEAVLTDYEKAISGNMDI